MWNIAWVKGQSRLIRGIVVVVGDGGGGGGGGDVFNFDGSQQLIRLLQSKPKKKKGSRSRLKVKYKNIEEN